MFTRARPDHGAVEREPAYEAVAALEGIAIVTTAGRAVHRAAGHVPFWAVCLRQAMACAIPMGRCSLPAVVRFGVARQADGALDAHAWTVSGGAVMTGARGMERFTPVAAFPP